MPLLRWKELIFNTDHIVKVDYQFKSMVESSLAIFFTDTGDRTGVQHNVIRLTGIEAQIVWSALSQKAEAIIPAPPQK
jgi:hypothetical protein